jgi:hypothetical protein
MVHSGTLDPTPLKAPPSQASDLSINATASCRAALGRKSSYPPACQHLRQCRVAQYPVLRLDRPLRWLYALGEEDATHRGKPEIILATPSQLNVK